jgi:hypothetical protein
MPPGIIADINSVSARQRDRFWSAHACALNFVEARDLAANSVLRGLSAVRPTSRSVRPITTQASPSAN